MSREALLPVKGPVHDEVVARGCEAELRGGAFPSGAWERGLSLIRWPACAPSAPVVATINRNWREFSYALDATSHCDNGMRTRHVLARDAWPDVTPRTGVLSSRGRAG